MRTLFLALALATSSALAGPCIKNDAWTGPDKTKHFAGGAVISSAAYLATGSKAEAVVASIALAALKETADRGSKTHTCSLQDFAITVAGGVAGAYGTSWVVGPRYIGFIKRF